MYPITVLNPVVRILSEFWPTQTTFESLMPPCDSASPAMQSSALGSITLNLLSLFQVEWVSRTLHRIPEKCFLETFCPFFMCLKLCVSNR